jgi:AcrR family transcriptional regulator
MAATAPRSAKRRPRLTRDRILRAALKLADERGIEAASMRNVGDALGVEAMSLYKHVANKDDLLGGVADLVMAEYEIPEPGGDWKAALRRSAMSAHEALRRHPWAGTVVESLSSPGPVRLRYLDAVVGVLREAGFPMPIVASAFMALDSHTYGFTLQELALPFNRETVAEVAGDFVERLPDDLPNLKAMAEHAMSGTDAVGLDFQFGLDLILDGLERLLKARATTGA